MLPSSPSPWVSNVSTTEVLITRATNPSLPEPNYALHLEVAEYINQKKANTPREAAMFIARIVNHRNPHIAMLALALLETLVQSCGYPFHLQIATKEFLNELVRRFPERPPPFPGPVMQRILDLINDWKEGICTESRWKDDLGNIRDMHRLLTFKGYRFRPLQRQQSTAASASNLKTAEELENEDREAQSAKLQELIRRGTPRDLAAAQELMKSLAGANPDAKPDYRTQALTELNKLESKVILLNEILDNVDTSRGERFATGDVYDQVASILSSARPKIQGWISNAETDDPESLNTFLEINDQINTVLNRYESYKKGDYVAASNPIPAEYGGAASRAQSDSLIDFDDSAPASNGAATQGSSAAPMDDLASLFASTPANPPQTAPPIGMGMGTGMGLGIGMNAGMGAIGVSAPTPTSSNGFGASMTSPPHPVHATRPGTTSPQGTPYGSIRLETPQTQSPSTPNYRGGQMQRPQSQYGQQPPQYQQQQHPQYARAPAQTQLFQQQPQMFSQGPQQPRQPQQFQQQPQQPQLTVGASTQPQGKDPFADLAGLF
ncbi:VHS-domain-containing protein [Amylocystis lapponica]|nr:VHS-domain-containing protein [Amylocystis lapponica]